MLPHFPLTQHRHLSPLVPTLPPLCRIHGYELYYSMELFDPAYDIYWLKYPLLKKMMADRRDVEWFLWMDTDTLITDFDFDIPFDKYQGFDLVFSGKDQKVSSLPLFFKRR